MKNRGVGNSYTHVYVFEICINEEVFYKLSFNNQELKVRVEQDNCFGRQ